MKVNFDKLLETDLDWWSTIKGYLNKKVSIPYFYVGEVWWTHVGLNIGIESNGKDRQLLRPIIILKKYNKDSFLSIPISTSLKKSIYNIPIGEISGRQAFANISQLRCLDSKRLLKKVCIIDTEVFLLLKRKISEIVLN